MRPSEEYSARQSRWRSLEADLNRRFRQIGNLRLFTALLLAFILWLRFGPRFLNAWWVLLPIAIFIVLLILHERVARRRAHATRAADYYGSRQSRLSDDWIGSGSTGERFRPTDHVYADDLDLFGRGSLFQLASSARTGAGEQALAELLLHPADADEVERRQEAIRELRPLLELREDIALLGADVAVSMHAGILRDWSARAPVVFAGFLRPLALTLAAFSLLSFLLFLSHLLPLWPFLLLFAADLVLIFILRRRVAEITEAIEVPAADLALLSLLLQRLSQQSFQSKLLCELQMGLSVAGLPAWRRIARLERWIELLDSADHLFIRLVGPALLWREQVALGIEAWRQKSGVQAAKWLQIIGDFEAFSSLAALAFERPEWMWPSLVDSGEPVWEAEGLRHPLLPFDRCQPNDLQLGRTVHLVIVSGSNMSGKSTLLRAVGLNTVLAWTGSPVAAARLTLSRLQLGACIRVSDSLLDNRSRFFAEISRIKQVMDLLDGDRPLLFLLDELLSGTNSHDRLTGASALARELVERGSLGLITTHDLALTQIGMQFENMHFADTMEEGRMTFNYKLQPGVVQGSNAIELMRLIGLHV